MFSAAFIISAKLWLLFPKIKIISSAEHSDEHMKHLDFIFIYYYSSIDLFCVSCVSHETAARDT